MESRGTVLVVDDEERIVRALARALREEGHEVVSTTSAREAEELLVRRSFDLLVVDNRMPQRSGLELVRDLVSRLAASERPQIVMMTAHAPIENAIEAMRLGAYDYLQKPFEVEELLVVARKAIDHQRLSRQHRYLLAERDEEFSHYGPLANTSIAAPPTFPAVKASNSASSSIIPPTSAVDNLYPGFHA